MDTLEKRVMQFKKMELPGQPMSIHMGTSYLITDLWQEVQRLREENNKLKENKNART